jgi:hypothetical protein
LFFNSTCLTLNYVCILDAFNSLNYFLISIEKSEGITLKGIEVFIILSQKVKQIEELDSKSRIN